MPSAFALRVSAATSHTWGALDVVEGELGDTGVELEQERQWLTDTASGTEDCDLGVLQCLC